MYMYNIEDLTLYTIRCNTVSVCTFVYIFPIHQSSPIPWIGRLTCQTMQTLLHNYCFFAKERRNAIYLEEYNNCLTRNKVIAYLEQLSLQGHILQAAQVSKSENDTDAWNC